MVTNVYCSCKGPEFMSLAPIWVAHNCPELQFWGPNTFAFLGHLYTLVHTLTQRHI